MKTTSHILFAFIFLFWSCGQKEPEVKIISPPLGISPVSVIVAGKRIRTEHDSIMFVEHLYCFINNTDAVVKSIQANIALTNLNTNKQYDDLILQYDKLHLEHKSDTASVWLGTWEYKKDINNPYDSLAYALPFEKESYLITNVKVNEPF